MIVSVVVCVLIMNGDPAGPRVGTRCGDLHTVEWLGSAAGSRGTCPASIETRDGVQALRYGPPPTFRRGARVELIYKTLLHLPTTRQARRRPCTSGWLRRLLLFWAGLLDGRQDVKTRRACGREQVLYYHP